MVSGTASDRKPLTALQARFVKSGFEGLDDQEVLELLLSLCLPPRKSKRLAKACFERFKSLREFLDASSEELELLDIPPPTMLCVKVLHELPAEILRQKIMEQPVYKSSKELFDYLYYSMRDLKQELFKVIYLNNRKQIMQIADLFEGTLSGIPIRPRDIEETAIKYGASALVFVHNHPSGDPTPSRSDKQLTRDLVFIGNILQVKVLDHIIIGGNRFFSFADEGLIEKYDDAFLNMRIRRLEDTRSEAGEWFHSI
jgi:DNA repair protein RadC